MPEIKDEEGATAAATAPTEDASPGADDEKEQSLRSQLLERNTDASSEKKSHKKRSHERSRSRDRRDRSRDRGRRSYRSRDRGRDRSRERGVDRERRERDRRGSPRRRRRSRSRSHSPPGRGRRRSRSRSYSHGRHKSRGREVAYDKEAVKVALERATAGGIGGPGWPALGMMGGLGSFAGAQGAGALAALANTSATAGVLHNPTLAALQSTMGMGAGSALPSAAAPASSYSAATNARVQGQEAALQAEQAARPAEDGKTKARDFSFLVTEDKQDSGPNLSMLDGSDSDSDSDSDAGEGGGAADGEEEGEGEFEAGSAIDQLLWRQKAVSGMETRRPGESVQQFFARRMAGMRMLKAEAGSHDAKALENEVDVAIMNSNTQWHWGAGDMDADLSDCEDAPTLALEGPSDTLQLEYKPTAPAEGEPPLPGGAPPPPPPGAIVPFGGGGASKDGAIVAFDPNRLTQKRKVLGSEAIRASAALVPRPEKNALSNDKLAPIESGRGLALLEKMGWKKGQGLGREGSGKVLPVEASIKTDMGGLRSDEEKYGVAPALMSADGPELSNNSFSVNASSMLNAAKASMDSEFSSITTQTKSVQQINEENRRAAAGLPPLPGAAAPAPATTLPAPAPAVPTSLPVAPATPAAPLATPVVLPPAPRPVARPALPPRPVMPPAAPHMMYNPMPRPGMPYPGYMPHPYAPPGLAPMYPPPQMHPHMAPPNMYGYGMPPGPWG